MGYLLSDIINEWLIEKGESQASQFARLYAIGVSGMRELHMDVNGLVKIAELPINANDTVDLPVDYMQYSKIGLCGADGRIHSLGLDNDLCLNKVYNNCGTPIRHQQMQGIDGISVNNNIINGLWLGFGFNGYNGGLFGLGGGNNANGYFRYDRAANQLLLANLHVPSCSIMLEYVSDINATGEGDFIVHPFEIQTVKDWISWKYVSNDRNTSLGEKTNRERMYWNSRRNMNLRYNSATTQQWAEALRKSNTATVRF